MAPGAGRRGREVQFPHELGKVGRRTGLTVPDSGVRDENGLEPMDHLFSSPEKALPVNGNRKGADVTNSSEEDMDVVDSTIPDPLQVLNDRQRASLRPPRSKSPRKTFLQSPARHNPAMGRGSSVDGTDSVVRTLDFTNGEALNLRYTRAVTSPRQQPKTMSKSAKAEQSNGIGSPNKLKRPFAFEDEEDESIAPVGGDNYDKAEDFQEGNPDEPAPDADTNGDGIEADEAVQDDEVEEEQEVEEEPKPKAPAKGRGRPAKSKAVAEPQAKEAQVARGKGRGRPAKANTAVQSVEADDREEEPAEEPAPANDDDEEEEDVSTRRRKRQKLSPVAEQPKRSRGRPAAAPAAQGSDVPKATKVKKVKAPKLVVSSPAEVIRQPPRPNANSGLLISRRETTNGLLQTRSGRHSFKPIAHWRNERVIYEESDIPNQQVGHFNTIAKQSIAEIVRIDEPEPQTKTNRDKRGRPKVKESKSSKKRAAVESDDDEDAEPWESEPGRIVADIRAWNPDDPTSSSAEDVPEEIALSNAAIQTRDIPGSTFKFAKTLTLPFFGSGMVDLPVGGIKKPKNSRNMHLCFFVFYGRVKVTVNETEFRIGKGGMWQVPRGNFYSIENDYDKPARIFFSQGSEVEANIPEE